MFARETFIDNRGAEPVTESLVDGVGCLTALIKTGLCGHLNYSILCTPNEH